MNLDELMSVWQSQDTAPLHDVNKTLLHLALRQEEAKLQKERRTERWIVYITCACLVAAMTFFLAIMIGASNRNAMTVWDYVVAIGGLATALLLIGVMYVKNKLQVRRERLFGESLRDQLKRRIAQLEDDATNRRWTLVMLFLAVICPIAILVLGWRVNGKNISEDGYMIVWLILMSFFTGVISIWELRRHARAMLPRKHRLEELLMEIDGP